MATPDKSSYAPSLSDEEIMASLRARVRSRMDGATAAAMRASGVDYAYNFGLSIPQLRDLASELPSRLSLAQKLLSAQLREMRILGLLSFPAETLTYSQAISFAKSLETEELLSLFSTHLLAKNENVVACFPQGESLRVQRVWLNAHSRRLLQNLPTSGLAQAIETTLERLSTQPETLSVTEMDWLERLYNNEEWAKQISPALRSWTQLPEEHPLRNVADYLLSL